MCINALDAIYVHMVNCEKLKWPCMTHFEIFGWKNIKFLNDNYN
jgi:hypothetical protein